jgi:hypothetical protein
MRRPPALHHASHGSRREFGLWCRWRTRHRLQRRSTAVLSGGRSYRAPFLFCGPSSAAWGHDPLPGHGGGVAARRLCDRPGGRARRRPRLPGGTSVAIRKAAGESFGPAPSQVAPRQRQRVHGAPTASIFSLSLVLAGLAFDYITVFWMICAALRLRRKVIAVSRDARAPVVISARSPASVGGNQLRW